MSCSSSSSRSTSSSARSHLLELGELPRGIEAGLVGVGVVVVVGSGSSRSRSSSSSSRSRSRSGSGSSSSRRHLFELRELPSGNEAGCMVGVKAAAAAVVVTSFTCSRSRGSSRHLLELREPLSGIEAWVARGPKLRRELQLRLEGGKVGMGFRALYPGFGVQGSTQASMRVSPGPHVISGFAASFTCA